MGAQKWGSKKCKSGAQNMCSILIFVPFYTSSIEDAHTAIDTQWASQKFSKLRFF
jgi:hypothetical protein